MIARRLQTIAGISSPHIETMGFQRLHLDERIGDCAPIELFMLRALNPPPTIQGQSVLTDLSSNAMRKISAAFLGPLFLVASARSQATPPAQVSSTEAPSHFAQVSGARLYYEECIAVASLVKFNDASSDVYDGVGPLQFGRRSSVICSFALSDFA